MISITKDLKSFIEDYDTDIVIYGAGNAGYWTGYYMNRCKVNFQFYLDGKVEKEGCLLNERPIFSAKNKAKELKGKEIRIFISACQYQSILYDLLELSNEYSFSALCYVPVGYVLINMNTSDRKAEYNINAALGYFRKQLIKVPVPTILSNDCFAGGVYQSLGLPMLSPTINVGLLEQDFIKLCENPEHYFNIEISAYEYGRITWCCNGFSSSADLPCSRIDDITVYWAHTDDDGQFLKRWNIMRNKVKYDNLICCLSNLRLQISYEGLDRFNKIKVPHYVIAYSDKYNLGKDNVIMASRDFPVWRMDTVIENFFDVLGWINGGK